MRFAFTSMIVSTARAYTGHATFTLRRHVVCNRNVQLPTMIHSLPNRNQLARLSLVGMRSMSGKVKEIEEQLRKDDAMEAPADLEGKVNLYALNQTRMEELLLDWGEPKFRAKQIWQWINVKGATDFDKMQDLPKGLRAKLAEKAVLGNLEIAVEQVSKDGTIKRAYKLKDGQMIESVLMPYDDGRRTACISSQAGCAMGCVFLCNWTDGFRTPADFSRDPGTGATISC
uniref:Dual-specificity RNA methyltransferase RlmN N-terminal domain-containing protein n=1 Tax=Guillardia theta TaxID=55529 RepID=A0A7S4N483_GUITH